MLVLLTPSVYKNYKDSIGAKGNVAYYQTCLIMVTVLHLYMVPQVRIGYAMMKFAVNHPHRFHNWIQGFQLGFWMSIIPIYIELLSALNLSW